MTPRERVRLLAGAILGEVERHVKAGTWRGRPIHVLRREYRVLCALHEKRDKAHESWDAVRRILSASHHGPSPNVGDLSVLRGLLEAEYQRHRDMVREMQYPDLFDPARTVVPRQRHGKTQIMRELIGALKQAGFSVQAFKLLRDNDPE